MVRPRGTDKARLMVVIQTQSIRGEGTKDDKCRFVFQYWDLNGKLLAEYDQFESENEVK